MRGQSRWLVVGCLVGLAWACSSAGRVEVDGGGDDTSIGEVLEDSSEEIPGIDVGAELWTGDVDREGNVEDVEGVELLEVLDAGDPEVESDVFVPAQGCCFSQEQCLEGQECVGVGEGLDGAGLCVAPAAMGRCFEAGDCLPGRVCEGAHTCRCGETCGDNEPLPGVCVVPGQQCVPIREEWVLEHCDAASLVIFDGSNCIETCPGCCACEPFCAYTYSSLEECESACSGVPACPTFIGGLEEQPFQYFLEWEEECPVTIAREFCDTDDFCPIAELGLAGMYCVLGNCVLCWNDTQCADGQLCRMGRCVSAVPESCPEVGPCSESGCHVIHPSESPCPVCVCGTVFDKECDSDEACMVFSSHFYPRCVYGRCAECRLDADCWDPGLKCIQPGLCIGDEIDSHKLWGVWLMGWFGALNHYSYFRFEPDGTFRRGHYESDGNLWVDDIPGWSCDSGEFLPWHPATGTWEPQLTDAGFLAVKLSLNAPCDNGAGWVDYYSVTLASDGQTASFSNTNQGMSFEAYRVPDGVCAPEFNVCVAPE